MFEFTPLNKAGEAAGEKRTLEHGASDSLRLFGDSARHRRRITFDYSGVVASTLAREKFTVTANPSPVKPFEGARDTLADLLEVGQEVVYTFRVSRSALASATDTDIVGVRARRLSPATK